MIFPSFPYFSCLGGLPHTTQRLRVLVACSRSTLFCLNLLLTQGLLSLCLSLFSFLFFFFLFLRKGFMQPKLVPEFIYEVAKFHLNFWFSCIPLSRARIIGVLHHSQSKMPEKTSEPSESSSPTEEHCLQRWWEGDPPTKPNLRATVSSTWSSYID